MYYFVKLDGVRKKDIHYSIDDDITEDTCDCIAFSMAILSSSFLLVSKAINQRVASDTIILSYSERIKSARDIGLSVGSPSSQSIEGLYPFWAESIDTCSSESSAEIVIFIERKLGEEKECSRT